MLRREEEEALAIGSPLELLDIGSKPSVKESSSCLQILDEEALEGRLRSRHAPC